MLADFHLHSHFSGDCESRMESMIERGIEKGLSIMCFTEHLDLDYPYESPDFSLDIPAYFDYYQKMKEQYQRKISLLFGVELGLQPHVIHICNDFVNKYPFDFVIGSSHVINGVDPYYPDYFSNRSEESAYEEYFTFLLKNLEVFQNFDVYGHIDYVVRYGPNTNQFYSYDKYRDIIDLILRKLIKMGKGIELNTGGFKYGLGHPNPHEDIIKRYRELGGEIITIGSDAHKPEHIAYDFHKVFPILKACGFHYYTIYKNRSPEFIKI